MYCGIICDNRQDIEAALESPAAPQVDPAIVAEADKLEVWHTSFNDPGPDYNEFRLYKGDKLLASRKQYGY